MLLNNKLIRFNGIYQKLPSIPEHWDCEQSIAKVKPLIYKWKNITLEIATELWIAREKLSAQGLRTDLGANAPKWSSYC